MDVSIFAVTVMDIPRPTLNGLFVLFIGLLMLGVGMYMCAKSWTRVTGCGLALIGFGVSSLGFTNGFSDQSPLGRLLYKLSLISLGVGVPAASYGFYSGNF